MLNNNSQDNNHENLKARYGLPKEVKYCKSCVISNQRPNSFVEFKNIDNKKIGINFDKEECEACKYAKIKE